MDMKARVMPILAILQHDLGSLASSWLVRIWVFVTGLLVFLQISGQWGQTGDAEFIATILFPYLIVWFLVVMMLGVGPVAGSRAESLADSILSRPVTRYEYLLASWAARVFAVLGAFLVVVVPVILLIVFADRPVPEDPVSSYGILASLFVVSLVLTLQVSLAFLLGTLLRRQMVAVAMLAFGWIVSMGLFGTFQLEEISPLSLSQAMPSLLRQSWSEEDESQETIEANEFSAIFKPVGNMMGFGSPPPKRDGQFFESQDFEDVSLWRVSLGYGLPTILAIGLATVIFCRRDL
jgi:ABC-2 type transport system permease protein